MKPKQFKKVIEWDSVEWNDGAILVVTALTAIPFFGTLFWILGVLPACLRARKVRYVEVKE